MPIKLSLAVILMIFLASFFNVTYADQYTFMSLKETQAKGVYPTLWPKIIDSSIPGERKLWVKQLSLPGVASDIEIPPIPYHLHKIKDPTTNGWGILSIGGKNKIAYYFIVNKKFKGNDAVIANEVSVFPIMTSLLREGVPIQGRSLLQTFRYRAKEYTIQHWIEAMTTAAMQPYLPGGLMGGVARESLESLEGRSRSIPKESRNTYRLSADLAALVENNPIKYWQELGKIGIIIKNKFGKN